MTIINILFINLNRNISCFTILFFLLLFYENFWYVFMTLGIVRFYASVNLSQKKTKKKKKRKYKKNVIINNKESI